MTLPRYCRYEKMCRCNKQLPSLNVKKIHAVVIYEKDEIHATTRLYYQEREIKSPQMTII